MRPIIKKCLAVLLTIVSMLTQVSCGSSSKAGLTMGQWLSMLCESFGMEEYFEDTPFFKDINQNHPLFSVCQAAAEWDIIDPKSSFDVNKALTWKEALLTLMNAGQFMDPESSDDDKVNAAVKKFDSSIRSYWMDRTIPTEKAVAYLAQAQKEWANKTFDKKVEEVEYKEDVKDYSKVLEKTDFVIDEEKNTITLKKDAVEDIKPGDVFILPAMQGNLSASAFKADSVEQSGDKLIVKPSDEELTIEDVVENLTLEDSFAPMAEDMIVEDGMGNIVHVGSNVQKSMSSGTVKRMLSGAPKTSGITRLDKGKITASFEIDGWKVSFEHRDNGKFNLSFKIESDNVLNKSYVKSHPSQALKFFVGGGINDLKITNEVNVKWFKLRSASVRADYEYYFTGGAKFTEKLINDTVAPKTQNYTSKNLLRNFVDLGIKDLDSKNCKGAKTIKIATIKVCGIGIASVCLDINFVVSVEGSIAVTVTFRGAKGVEYKDGKTRLININDKDVDIEIKAKIEATAGVGPAIYALGLKRPIIGLMVSGGVGAIVSIKFHLADTEGHEIEQISENNFNAEMAEYFTSSDINAPIEVIKEVAASQGGTYEAASSSGDIKLHFDVCTDIGVYFILKVEITQTSYIRDLVTKATLSWQPFDEKNAKFLHLHMDNLGPIQARAFKGANDDLCTLKYIPFESVIPESTEADESAAEQQYLDTLDGIALSISEFRTSIPVGKIYYIQLTDIPKGYYASELICTSLDESIVSVTNEGVVTAKSPGNTVVTVSTKDNKYTAAIAINVYQSDMNTK